MQFVLIFLLVIAWAVVIASYVRGRAKARNVNSISSFNKHLSVLERTSPARQGFTTIDLPERDEARARRTPTEFRDERPGRPSALLHPGDPGSAMTLGAARRRRRDVVFVLAAACVGSGALWLLVGQAALVLFLTTAALLAGYVVLLVRAQRIATERRAKVLYLPTGATTAQPEPVLLLQRSAN